MTGFDWLRRDERFAMADSIVPEFSGVPIWYHREEYIFIGTDWQHNRPVLLLEKLSDKSRHSVDSMQCYASRQE